jgi:hypothetical protein
VDIETFHTGSPIRSGKGYQQESWVNSAEDCAVSVELSGEFGWRGPWNIGTAGQFAWTRGWNNLPFWITGEKRLATLSAGGFLPRDSVPAHPYCPACSQQQAFPLVK